MSNTNITTQKEQLNQNIVAARTAYDEAMQRHAALKNDARDLEGKIAALKSDPATSIDDLAKVVAKQGAMALMLPEAASLVERRWQDFKAAQMALDNLAASLAAKQHRANALRREVADLQRSADEARHQAAQREQLRDYRAGELAQLEAELLRMG